MNLDLENKEEENKEQNIVLSASTSDKAIEQTFAQYIEGLLDGKK